MKVQYRSCYHCSKPIAKSDNLYRCKNCKVMFYCNRKCQKDNWALHKTVCADAEAARLRWGVDRQALYDHLSDLHGGSKEELCHREQALFKQWFELNTLNLQRAGIYVACKFQDAIMPLKFKPSRSLFYVVVCLHLSSDRTPSSTFLVIGAELRPMPGDDELSWTGIDLPQEIELESPVNHFLVNHVWGAADRSQGILPMLYMYADMFHSIGMPILEPLSKKRITLLWDDHGTVSRWNKWLPTLQAMVL
ncbi:hypothetical protein EWM64_g10480 [Hericium alpestre]|uniref:MYND-type domain-containing protein n=1 Tax=Hericium alpestre TaxID=135208 RepID=A0A4Y9ZG30_9AGAM|nr:hypothetical protein EWM64_g10480 [Hericium alpestre]